MKRNTIEELLNGQLTETADLKSIVNTILNEAGKDLENLKTEINELKTENETLNSKLTTATDTISSLEEIDADGLKNKISELETALSQKDAEHAEKIATMNFEAALEKSIAGAGGKNAKAVKALLDMDALKNSQNQNEDIQSAIDGLKESDSYLFNSNEPINNPTGPTGNSAGSSEDAATSAIRKAMGLN